MRVRCVSFGKIKTPGLRETANHYIKLLGAWVDFKEVELKATEIRSRDAPERERVQGLEAQALRDSIASVGGARPVIVWLDETGKALPTSAWAERVRKWEGASATALVFVVGGAVGLAPELRKNSGEVLNLGPQTLSHELARVVLLEQIYRAWSITRGHPYHIGG